jgi:transcriptional regulator with XRE-family HTH domain
LNEQNKQQWRQLMSEERANQTEGAGGQAKCIANNALGKALHTKLKEVGQSREWLASRIRVTESTLSLWINGRRVPKRLHLCMLSRELGISYNRLRMLSDSSANRIRALEAVVVLERKLAMMQKRFEKKLATAQTKTEEARNEFERQLTEAKISISLMLAVLNPTQKTEPEEEQASTPHHNVNKT